MREQFKVRIGIDLGGTKTELIALAAESHADLLRLRETTPAGDYDASLAQMMAMVAEAERRLGCQATVGVGTPGAISQVTGHMKNCNSTWLNDRPLKQDLEALLKREIRISNDANCFALSEAVDGAAAGAGSVFGVIAGTGTGAGIVINGRVLEGANRIAGEWGHNPLPWPNADELPGPRCYCGRSGCIETWLSGPGLAADHLHRTGRSLTAEQIAREAAGGDGDAAQTLLRHADRMARGLAHVINILDPEVIVLGGGISNIDSLYDEVPARWGAYIFSDAVRTRLVAPKHGDSSGVRGAAWLWN